MAAESLSHLIWQENISVKALTEARLDYERLILHKVFERITSDELDALAKCVEDLEALVAHDREQDYPTEPVLTDFHILLARATKNPVFPIIAESTHGCYPQGSQPGRLNMRRLESHAAYHRAIYEALKRRDLPTALETIEQHMIEIAKRECLKETPGLLTLRIHATGYHREITAHRRCLDSML